MSRKINHTPAHSMKKYDTHVSSCMRLVSTMGSTAGLLPPSAVAALSSPFSFVLASDLWEPDDEDGRSSSGFGCINVNGNSATNSLKY